MICTVLLHCQMASCCALDHFGSCLQKERQVKVDSFNRDAATFAFLISTKAGGLGLNLTSANKWEILIVSADIKQSSKTDAV